MQRSREIELKLECDGPDLTVLSRHPLLQIEDAPGPETLIAVYYDTADHALCQAGLSLRVRREGDRLIQTVKAASTAAGLFDRLEWEHAIDGPEPDANTLATTPAAQVLAEAEAPDLLPLFTITVERTTRPIHYGTSNISATLDVGRIETTAGDLPVCEAELELKDGTAVDLFALAQALAETVPLRLGALSKGARGYGLIAGTLRRPSKAERFALDAEATAGEAFVQIAQACLRHLRLNEAVFLHGQDSEALHQMRVALRRLRSAFTLFKPMLVEDATAQNLREEIKRVTEPFGRARNLDVFLGETLPAERARRPDEPGLDDLREHLLADRGRAYEAVLATLESRAWRGLLIDLVTWIQAGPWRQREGTPERDQPVPDFAASVLDRLRQRVKKRGRHLSHITVEARHELRIEAKKLRYGAEFFGSLYTGRKDAKRHKAFVSTLSDLQDCLGALNDLATAHAIVDHLAEPGTGGDPRSVGRALFAAGLTAAGGEARGQDLLGRAEVVHETLMALKPFWR